MKIWVYIIWILSVVMWAITIILGHVSSKVEEEHVDSATFYSYLIVIFLLITMISTVLCCMGEVK